MCGRVGGTPARTERHIRAGIIMRPQVCANSSVVNAVMRAPALMNQHEQPSDINVPWSTAQRAGSGLSQYLIPIAIGTNNLFHTTDVKFRRLRELRMLEILIFLKLP